MLNLLKNPTTKFRKKRQKLLQSKMVNQEIFHNRVTQLIKPPDLHEVEVQFLF